MPEDPAPDTARRLRLALGGLGTILAIVIGVSAYLGFPVMDDGEILTTAREAGTAQLIPAYRDRPVCGWLTEVFVSRFREVPVAWVVAGLVAWAFLAGLTALLVRRLAPRSGAAAALAVLLVVSPIVVQTQFATLSMIVPGNVSVCLALGAILVATGPDGPGRRVLSFLLAAGGAVISEYAVATLEAGTVLLLVLRRWRRSIPFLAGGLAGHVVYRLTSDAGARPSTEAGSQLALALHGWREILPLWFNGFWLSVLGAYGSAVGAVRIHFDSRSTLLAAVVGVACALLVASVGVSRGGEDPTEPGALAGLFAAVLIGLLPVIFANRDPSLDDFGSRFRLAILPFAAAATVCLLERVAADRWRRVLQSLLAFVAGFTVVMGGFRVVRHQRFLEEIGRQILPIAQRANGIVVVVVPEAAYALPWAKIVRHFPIDAERRVFSYYQQYSEGEFGPRDACKERTAEFVARPTLRVMGRRGPISNLLLARDEGRVVVEPYCREPRPGDPPARR